MVSTENGWNAFQSETDQSSMDAEPFWERIMRHPQLVWVGAGTLATCLVGLGILVFVALGDRQERPLAGSDVPLITADKAPFKVRPEDPGGLHVPDRNRLVYNQMRGSESVVVVERLLTEPEQPLRPPYPAPTSDEQKSQPITANQPPAPDGVTGVNAGAMVEPSHASERNEEDSVPSETTADAPRGGGAVGAEVSKLPVPKARPQGSNTLAVDVPTATHTAARADSHDSRDFGRQFYVQLLAVRSSSAAMTEWNRLNAKHGDVLAGLSPSVSLLERGGQNPLFRLRAGPLKNEGTARATCRDLIARNVGCVVVAPGA